MTRETSGGFQKVISGEISEGILGENSRRFFVEISDISPIPRGIHRQITGEIPRNPLDESLEKFLELVRSRAMLVALYSLTAHHFLRRLMYLMPNDYGNKAKN